MRLVAGITLVNQGISRLSGGTSTKASALGLIEIALAMLLGAGLWTPVAGTLVALIELWYAYSRPGELWFYIPLGTLSIALVLLGPGAWSVDARLFGWKRVEIRDRKN